MRYICRSCGSGVRQKLVGGGLAIVVVVSFGFTLLTSEFERSLEDLLERACRHRTALMCAEAVPWRCHRSLIADALVVRAAPVKHILSASRTQPHVLRPWAEVRGTRITYPPHA